MTTLIYHPGAGKTDLIVLVEGGPLYYRKHNVKEGKQVNHINTYHRVSIYCNSREMEGH